MLSLHTNAAALSTQNALGGTQKALTTSMSRLGTGFRINSAKDDAAGLQIATRLNAQSRGMTVAMRNTQNGISLLQTAEGALSEVSNILLRMKDLATEAYTATSSTADRTAMQAEYTALGDEVTNILTSTSFGGAALLQGGSLHAGAITFQIGASASETMSFNAQGTGVATAMDRGAANVALVTGTGVTGVVTGVSAIKLADALTADTSVAGTANARNIITSINNVVNTVSALRSSLGSGANRLDHVYNNLANIRTNTDQAKGRIMDVDYASETANMTTKQMLMQASTSMLKQSGSMSQLVMSLMQ